MDQVDRAIAAILAFIVSLFYLVVRIITLVEDWMRAQLSQLGVAQNLQTIILVVVAVAVLLVAIRLLSGILRIALVILIVLIAAHLLLPLTS
jgi:hypothetical protein